MIVLQAEVLELLGIPFRATPEILFRNKLFIRGGSFSKRIYQRIVADLQTEYRKSRILYLLVDSGEHFTVWREAEQTKSTAASFNRLTNRVTQEVARRQPLGSVSRLQSLFLSGAAIDITNQLSSN